MKILLVQSYSKNMKPLFPIGIATLASAVRENNELHVFDPNIVPRWPEELKKKIVSLEPDIVAVSLRNTDSVDYIGRDFFYPDFQMMVKIIKSSLSNGSLIVGGSAFSLFADQIMKECPEIDLGMFLEADESFPELLQNLGSPEKVQGVYYRKDDGVEFTGQRAPVDFGSVAGPAYELFDLKRYVSLPYGIGVESKRGCGLNCAYCPYPFLNGTRVRIKAPEKVVDEMEKIMSYGIKHISFVDSVFNVPLQHSIDICEEISRRKLDVMWSCWSNEKFFTEEFARAAIKAGCRIFPFSTDAFSDKSLKMLHKNYTNEDIRNTVEVAKKVDNIDVGYGFFLNPPGATVKSFFQMIAFLVKSKLTLGKKMKRMFVINRIRVEPHTALHELAIKEGLVKEGQSLLEPVYYTQPSTKIIELAYNLYALPMGLLMRLKRKARRIIHHG